MTAREIAQLPRHHGPAAWNSILPQQDTAPRLLEQDITADVAVVGAGFAGLAAARRLTQLEPNAQIVVLDAGLVGEGAAGRNSGFMIDLPHDLSSEDYAGSGDDTAQIALNRAAQRFAAQAVTDYQIDPAYFDRAGKVNGAASDGAEAHNSSYAAHLDGLGEPFERYDAAQMADLTGSRYYQSGLFTPGTVMLQPAGFVRGMAAGLKRAGVAIYEQTPLLSYAAERSGWSLNTPNGSVSVGRVILAVNGHLESAGFAQGELMHVMLFAAMTPELDRDTLRNLGGAARWGITPSDPMGTTIRRIDTAQGGNRIITRTCAALRPDMEPTQADMRRAKRVMQSKFEARFPALKGLKMEHHWAGHLCLTGNGVAVTGELEPGLFSACIQNGLGTARGTLTGIAAAELACGATSMITDHFAAQAAPTPLPPVWVQKTAGNAVLRVREWRARAE